MTISPEDLGQCRAILTLIGIEADSTCTTCTRPNTLLESLRRISELAKDGTGLLADSQWECGECGQLSDHPICHECLDADEESRREHERSHMPGAGT